MLRPLTAALALAAAFAGPGPAAAHFLAEGASACPAPPAAALSATDPARTTDEPVDGDAPPPDALVDALLVWIGAATGYDIAASRADPPAIAFCSAGQIVPYEGDPIAVPGDLRGAYDHAANRIYLARPWSAENLRDRAVLLHELAHHVQLRNRAYDCVQEPEWQAYKLQDAWLRQHGIEAGFNWLVIYLSSQCPRDHHP